MLDVFVCLLVCAVGGGIAAIIVSKYVHQPLFKASEGIEMYELEYEYKYLDELETLDRDTPLSPAALKALADRTVEERTPCGRIVMTYNHEDERFEYWSEQSHIPYKTLDTVARKFCVDNDCRAIYIDVYEQLYLDCSTMEKATSEGSSSDDTNALYGKDAEGADCAEGADDYAEGAEGAEEGADDCAEGAEEDAKIFEPEEDEELQPLLSRSDGCNLSDYSAEEPKRKYTDELDKPEPKKKRTGGVFAAFKDYNAPVKALCASEEPEHKTKNSFMRRGTYYDWTAYDMEREEKAKREASPQRGRSRHRRISYRDYVARLQ